MLPSDIYGDIKLMQTPRGRYTAKRRGYFKHDIIGMMLFIAFYYSTNEIHTFKMRIIYAALYLLCWEVIWQIIARVFYRYTKDRGDMRFSIYGGIQATIVLIIIKLITLI